MLSLQCAEYDAIHRESFDYDVPNGLDAWLLIFIHTAAIFQVNGALIEYPPSSFVLYKPKQRIYYRACEERFSNDWMRFLTDEPYITTSAVPGGVPLAVNNPGVFHRLFQLICYELEKPTAMSEVVLDRLMQIMFIKMDEYAANKPTQPLAGNLQELRSRIYCHPGENWTIERMAQMLNISRGHLEKIYDSAFGLSCMEDVILSRVSMAKKYLLNSHLTITEIASMCGYQSVEHFHRQFKKVTNYTPGSFRADLAFQNNASLWPGAVSMPGAPQLELERL